MVKLKKKLIKLDQLFIKNQKERPSIKDIIHKYVFISKSKETNLYDYLDKIINPQNQQKKRVFSSKIDNKRNNRLNRPITALPKRNVKKSANIKRNKEKSEEKNKINLNNNNKEIEILTDRFINVKKNVKDIIGEEKADELFKELNDVNTDEMIHKYYINDINNKNNKNSKDIDKENIIKKSEELKTYVGEYINILNKVLSYKKNKE